MKRLFSAALAAITTVLPAYAQIDTRADKVTASEVPAAAYGPQVDMAKGYAVAEIKPGSGVYWVTEGSHQAMFFTTGSGVVLVDAPPILGDRIVAAVAEVTGEPVTHLVYSHPHADHIGGAWQFAGPFDVLASGEAAERLETLAAWQGVAPFGTFVGGKPVPAVTRVVADGETVQIGSQVVEFHQLPGAHSDGDLAVLLPEHGILMAVDVVWPGWIPFDSLGHTHDVGAYIAAHDALLALDWDVLVAGHVGRLGTRADVETDLAYVNDLTAAVAKALQTTDYMKAGEKAGFSNAYLTVETYFDMVAATAAAEVEAKWVTKLGGADVWTYANARTVMAWLRLN